LNHDHERRGGPSGGKTRITCVPKKEGKPSMRKLGVITANSEKKIALGG